jgi:hypothetical protein
LRVGQTRNTIALALVMPEADIHLEAERLLTAAGDTVPLRLLGGVAIHRHADGRLDPAFARECKDIDFATLKGSSDAVAVFLGGAGYEPDTGFNMMNGHRRLLFRDRENRRQLDVFVGAFSMCHSIPIDRFEADAETLPLAELLLTKLQIVELNAKDRSDACALLYHHAVGEGDDDVINAAVIARLCARDWGLWRTCRLNSERIREAIRDESVPAAQGRVIIERLDALWAAIDAEPKTRAWRMRNRVGDRVRWYVEPEEVE